MGTKSALFFDWDKIWGLLNNKQGNIALLATGVLEAFDIAKRADRVVDGHSR